MATTATPTYTHITVPNSDGSKPGDRWQSDSTYKVPQSAADTLGKMKKKPTGSDLANWLEDHGGVLDDGNGQAGRVSRKNDGTILNDHYKDGTYTGDDVVSPPGSKADAEAGVTLFMTLITGGAYPILKAVGDAQNDGNGSKFTSTTPSTTPPSTQPAPTAAKTTAPKPPKPQ